MNEDTELVAAVQEGLDALEEGRVLSHEEVKARFERLEQREWLVWSYEHWRWWKPNRRGYTTRLSEAGRYTLRQATTICESANRYADTVQEKMVHESAAAEFKPLDSARRSR